MTSNSRGPEPLLLLILLISAVLRDARAQEPVPAAEPEPVEQDQPDPVVPAGSDEIVVYGDLEIARRRNAVIRDLRDLGYREGKRQENYTVFRPEDPWKPTVRVYDDGFIVLKRSPVRFAAPGDPDKPLNYLWCLPPFTPMCVRVGGQVVSARKLSPQKARVAYGLEPGLRDWREALVARAMQERVGVELPAQLDALWYEGVPLDPDQPRIPTPDARRAAILSLWASRTCTPEGEQVREAIAVYLSYEVQTSAWPLTPDEIEQAGRANACGRQLDLLNPGL